MASAKKHFDDYQLWCKNAPGIEVPERGKPPEGSKRYNAVKKLDGDLRHLIPPNNYSSFASNPFEDCFHAFSIVKRGFGKTRARINAAIDILDPHDPIKAAFTCVDDVQKAVKCIGSETKVVDTISKHNNDCARELGFERDESWDYRTGFQPEYYEVDVTTLRQSRAALQAIEEELATHDIRRTAAHAIRRIIDGHFQCFTKHLSEDYEGMIFCMWLNFDNPNKFRFSYRPK
jgi:hypothetical protein